MNTFIGEAIVANEDQSKLFVQLENGDRVDITDLVLDHTFLEDREIPGLTDIVISSIVKIE